jgi:hypothetical protein
MAWRGNIDGGDPRAFPDRDIGKPGDGGEQCLRDRSVFERKAARSQAGNLGIGQEVRSAGRYRREPFDRHGTRFLQTSKEAERFKVRHARWMNQFARKPARMIQPGLNNEDVVTELGQGSRNRRTGNPTPRHDYIDLHVSL